MDDKLIIGQTKENGVAETVRQRCDTMDCRAGKIFEC